MAFFTKGTSYSDNRQYEDTLLPPLNGDETYLEVSVNEFNTYFRRFNGVKFQVRRKGADISYTLFDTVIGFIENGRYWINTVNMPVDVPPAPCSKLIQFNVPCRQEKIDQLTGKIGTDKNTFHITD